MSKLVKPYLFKVVEQIGGMNSYSYVMARTSDPVKKAHEIAESERGGSWDSEEQGYNLFGESLIKLPKWKEITEQEADDWLKAKSLESSVFQGQPVVTTESTDDEVFITVFDRVTAICDRTRVYAVQKEEFNRAQLDGLDDEALFDTLQETAKLKYVSGELEEDEVVFVHSNEFDIPTLELKDEFTS